VIFAIRSRLPLRRSRPNGILAALTIGVVAIAALMPLSPVGHWFGFVTLPLGYYGFWPQRPWLTLHWSKF
jgi:Mg2+-importing ATPase